MWHSLMLLVLFLKSSLSHGSCFLVTIQKFYLFLILETFATQIHSKIHLNIRDSLCSHYVALALMGWSEIQLIVLQKIYFSRKSSLRPFHRQTFPSFLYSLRNLYDPHHFASIKDKGNLSLSKVIRII